MLRSKSGQALLELAVFGALALMIVASMINYGLMLNRQQEMDMYAFRRALQFSQARYNDDEADREVTFTASQEILPVNLLDRSVDRQQVTGSGTVNWEMDPSTLNGEDANDYPTQFWQWDKQMITNNEAVQMPRMYVKRNREDKKPRGFIDWVVEIVSAKSHSQKIWMAAPIEQSLKDSTKITNVTETTTERAGIRSGLARVSSQENGKLTMVMKTDAQIKEADRLIVSVLSKPGDITVNENGTIQKNRNWRAWVK